MKRARAAPAPPPDPKRNRRVRVKAEPVAPAPPRRSARERLAAVRARALGALAKLKRPAELALRAVVVVAIGAGAVALGRLVERHVRTSPAFEVTEIALEGHVRLAREAVLEQAGLALGQNVFDVSPEEAEAALADHPWVAEANVTRRLPGTYAITVRERRPVALLALSDVFLVADNGEVFKVVGDDDPIDLPVITGIDRARFTRDRVYRTSILLEAVALLSDYRGAGLARRETIGELHVERDDGLSVYIGEPPTYVRLGHGPFRDKLGRLRTVLEELAARGARAEYVYLDNARRPDRVTVRVRDVAEPAIAEAAPAPRERAAGAALP
ncbi:MAG: FtsQ-type POTRA domain-containing protein [Sandaracinaceae bacterium]|nr:FtsQ-type POTRA domain-containing protein [Sandaracinaceae bacterium]